MTQQCNLHRLGMMPYERVWRLQEQLSQEIADGSRPPTLLLLEHPHTYTFGRRGKAEHLLWDEAELAGREVSVHWVDRGGDITYHGPGQLVGYPLLPLAPGGLAKTHGGSQAGENKRVPHADYVGYLRRLELALIAALSDFGIRGRQVDRLTGVWIDEQQSAAGRCSTEIAKVASIGVKVDVNGISRHGFALNVHPDMTYWDGIIGCGLEDYHEISMADLIHPVPDIAQVMDTMTACFADEFAYQMNETVLVHAALHE